MPMCALTASTLPSSVLAVCITPLGSPVVPEVYWIWSTSLGAGRRSAKAASRSSSSSQGRSLRLASKELSPSQPTTSTCRRWGNSGRSPSIMAG
jgi:hypothetical protein